LDFKKLSGAAKRGSSVAGLGVRARLPFFAPIFALGAVFFVISATAVAQQPPRPDAGSVLEGVKPPAALPKSPVEVLPQIAEPRPALGAPGLKVTVTRFKISGNTIFPEDVLLATLKEFVGKEQNIDGLNDAATKVRAYYRERGYFLSQAYLPQQEVREGVVEIAVIEARLGNVSIDIKEGTRLSESLIRGIVETHLKQGDQITETGLETPLLLLNDLPNSTVTSEIKPSQIVGAADLTVKVSETPGQISGQIGLDNYGNRYTGAIRATLDASLSNPLGLGDQLSFGYIQTDDDMALYHYSYTLPVGPWGTRVGLSWTQFHYQLGKDFASLLAHGNGTIAAVNVLHPIIRTRAGNLILQYSYDEKKLDDRIDSTTSITDRSVVASHLGVVGDLRDGLLGGGLNSFSYMITEGDANINQALVLAADQSATGLKTAGRYAKTNFEFRRLQKITDQTNLLLAVQGQVGSKNLSSVEKFSLGGVNGVRAYPTGEALGDTGFIFQSELRYLVPGWKAFGGDVTIVGFWDQGYAVINRNPLPTDITNKRDLSGYGLGGSLGREGDFMLRAYAAWRNEREGPTSDPAPRVPRMWVQGIKWF
jgi:hemolysin activation/secretion protein